MVRGGLSSAYRPTDQTYSGTVQRTAPVFRSTTVEDELPSAKSSTTSSTSDISGGTLRSRWRPVGYGDRQRSEPSSSAYADSAPSARTTSRSRTGSTVPLNTPSVPPRASTATSVSSRGTGAAAPSAPVS